MNKIRNKSKSELEWLEITKRCVGSNLTIADFCKEEGISETAYYKNRKLVELSDSRKSEFLEVNLGNEERSRLKLVFELRFSKWELILNLGGC
jgi:hypothetical protein